jgi:hypothetical protein
MEMKKPDNREPLQTAGTQLYHEVWNLIERYSKESDLTVYEAIGALEAVKADMLSQLPKINRA